MRRIGDLLPEAAAALGLDGELALARAMASWQRIVAEHVPPAAGGSELLAIRPDHLLVAASEPIVAQELRLRSSELLDAFASAPGGSRLPELRIVVRTGASRPEWRARGAAGPT
jgi:Dna[CI] antecedent, DciA